LKVNKCFDSAYFAVGGGSPLSRYEAEDEATSMKRYETGIAQVGPTCAAICTEMAVKGHAQ
jgi:hypothetical protein